MLVFICLGLLSTVYANELKYKFIGNFYDPKPFHKDVWGLFRRESANYFPSVPRYLRTTTMPRQKLVLPRYSDTYAAAYESNRRKYGRGYDFGLFRFGGGGGRGGGYNYGGYGSDYGKGGGYDYGFSEGYGIGGGYNYGSDGGYGKGGYGYGSRGGYGYDNGKGNGGYGDFGYGDRDWWPRGGGYGDRKGGSDWWPMGGGYGDRDWWPRGGGYGDRDWWPRGGGSGYGGSKVIVVKKGGGNAY